MKQGYFIELADGGPWLKNDLTWTPVWDERGVWCEIVEAELAMDRSLFVESGPAILYHELRTENENLRVNDIRSLRDEVDYLRSALTEILNLCQQTCMTPEDQCFAATRIAQRTLNDKTIR